MILSNTFLPLLTLVSIAEAQGINFGKILKKKPQLSHTHNTPSATIHTSQIATSIVKHLESIKPTTVTTTTITRSTKAVSTKAVSSKTGTTKGASTKASTTKRASTPTAKAGTAGVAPKVKFLPCQTNVPLYNYTLIDSSPTGFIVDSNLAGIAKTANNYPAGYSTNFTNAYGSLFADNYLDAYDLSSYNNSACAVYCNANPQCTAFNIYFERQPSLVPADQCTNPSAVTGVRCALWGSQVNGSEAQNVGQWRVDFMVVIQGSNGYNKNAAASSISGYKTSVPLAGAIDTRPLVATGASDPFISSDFSTGNYNPQHCADLCTNATTTARQTALSAGKTSYQACNYFNAVQLSLNGVGQGTYCQLYSRDVSSYTGLYTTTNSGTTYDLLTSNGYAVSNADAGVLTISSTTSTVSPTATYTPSSVTAATVTFVTVTVAWASKSTVTSTVFKGTAGTILVQTPGVVTSSSAAAYTTTSVNGGTALTISTTTLPPASAGGPSIVRIAYPTPAQTCGNSGIRYAAYQNVWAGSADSSANYTTYNPESFKTLKPMYNGTTSFIAETNSGWYSYVKVYDQYVVANNLTLDHVFYIFANQDGNYAFNMPQGDNFVALWLGPKAISGWTRANADLIQYYTSSPQKVPQTITVPLKMGQFVAARLHWGNRQGDGEVDLNVYSPDGSLIMYSNLGQGTGNSTQNVIQFPCDSSLGPQFPAWGAET